MNGRKWVKRLTNIFFLSFIIPVIAILGIMIYRGVYPFGNNSFMHCDMYHQYVPFLAEFWRKLHGAEDLIFSWNTGLGSDFVAVYGYYLASPFNWLAYFLPENLLIEFMTYQIVLKIGLCGLTFAWYLSRRFQTKHPVIIGFAMMYAFSGFVAAYNWNHMWMDCIWLAPLILLGLEQLVKEGKCRLYCIALTASIFTNYYMSIMICLFLVLYFIVQLFTNGLSFRQKGRAVWQFSLYSLLAGGMAGGLLVPVLSAMHMTEFRDFNFPQKIKFYFNGLEMLARHFVRTPKEIGLDHWPNIYCGVFVFVLVPLFLLHKKIPLKQRIGKLLLAAFMLLGFSTNLLNFIWHGLNYPDSLPARQSYLYIFLILSMSFEALYRIREIKIWRFVAAILAGCGILAACGIFVTTEGFTIEVAALTWAFLAALLLAVCWYLRMKSLRHWIVLAGVALLIGESTYNMFETSVSVVQRGYYTNKWNNYQELLKTTEGEQGFFRYESFCSMTKNDGTLAGYPTVSLFSSTTNSHIAEYYDDLGMSGSKVSYYTSGLTPFTSALLGVRYTFSDKEEDPRLYEYVEKSNDMYLYRNRYTLPVGFVTNYSLQVEMEEEITEAGSNPIKTQNNLAATIYDEEPLFEYAFQAEDREEGSRFFRIAEDGHYYVYLSGDPGESLVMEEGSSTTEYNEAEKNSIVDVGYRKAGEEFTFTPEEGKFIRMWAYRINEDVLATIVTTLGSQPLQITDYKDGWLKGTVDVEKAGKLILSVPYEPGWKILVDGKEVSYEEHAGAMISLLLPAGQHEIEMQYERSGFAAGILLTLLSLVIFAGILAKQRK